MKKIESKEFYQLYNKHKDNLALHSTWTEQTGWMTAWSLKDDDPDIEPLLKSEYSMPMDKRWAKDGHSDEALKEWNETRKDPANWEYWKREATDEK